MAHLSFSRTRVGNQPEAWQPVSVEIGKLARDLSKEPDIFAIVGPNAGTTDAVALFYPTLGELEVNTNNAFGPGTAPSEVGNLCERHTQFAWPTATGLILHESMHARHTKYDFRTIPADVRWIVEMFEESRIEARGATHFPDMAQFLRASTLEIIVKENATKLDEILESGWFGLINLALLTSARIDAGVVSRDDVGIFDRIIREELPEDLYDFARQCWIRAQKHSNDADPTELVKIARELHTAICDALPEEQKTQPRIIFLVDPPEGEVPSAPTGGAHGEGEGAAVPSKGEGDDVDENTIIIDLRTKLEDAFNETEDAAQSAIRESDDVEQRERDAAEAEARAEDAKEAAKEEKIARRIFDKDHSSSGRPGGTDSRLVEKRAPRASERSAAVQLAKQLDKARYRDREVRSTNSALPPGRMRGRAMVAQTAQIAAGQTPTATPWRAKHRKHVDDPTLTIGVMVDISGSMGSAMQPMASAAWILSEAARRIDGRTAMVYFGASVFPVLRPGQHLDQVNVYTAPDGTEQFSTAFSALDGALNLTRGTGARLLFVVSDTCYREEQANIARQRIPAAVRAGVAVTMLDITGHGRPKTYEKFGASYLNMRGTAPEAAAIEIGLAAQQALQSVR